MDEENRKTIQPLPNLDYKIVCGNSLLKVEKGDLFLYQQLQDMEKYKKLYLTEVSPAKKQEYRNKIDDLIKQITNNNQNFDFEIYFSEVFHDHNKNQGFDVVIANPPYVRQEKISDKEIIQASIKKDFLEYFSSDKSKIDAKSDLYTYFYVRGMSLLNKSGIETFICSNSWLDVGYGAWLQKFLLEKAQIDLILDNSIQRTFESADINTIISFIRALPNELNLNHLVRFVTFKKPFEEAVMLENLQAIRNAKSIKSNDVFRVYPISVSDLLEFGKEQQVDIYVGDKWGGKYLRAPDIYFTILRKGGVLTQQNHEHTIERERERERE